MTSKRNRSPSKSKALARKSFLGAPPLLPGEDERAYSAFFEHVTNGLQPPDVIGEILVSEAVNRTWDIARDWRMKSRIIADKIPECLGDILKPHMRTRHVPIEESEPLELAGLLRPLPPAPPRPTHPAYKLARKWAAGDPIAVARVEKIMASRKLTMDDVYAAAISQNLSHLERFDQKIMVSEGLRNALFREIDRRRSIVAQSLRCEVHQIEDAEYETIEPKRVHSKSVGDKKAE